MAALSEPPSANGRDPVAIDEDLADDPTVREHRHPLVGVGGGDALDGAARAARRTPSAGSALGITSQRSSLIIRTAIGSPLGHLLAEQAALPVAEEHLVEVGVDDHLQVEGVGQRLRGLPGAAELRHVDGVDALAGEPGAHLDRLLPALGRQLGVAVAVDEVERLPDHGRGGLAMADEDQLGGARRGGEAVLAVGAGLGHGGAS